jgi:hypothetical protein
MIYHANPATPPFKDRKSWLTVLGVLEILAGGLCGFFTLVILRSLFISIADDLRASPREVTTGVLSIVLIYGGLGATLVWLGIGSILARRWARALLLIFSWLALLAGLCLLGATVIHLATLGQTMYNVPHPAILWILFAVMLALGVGTPLTGILFYGSRHTKATCETRNPWPSWTDRCPLPVLALVLLTLVSLPFHLLSFCHASFTLPFFGCYLTGKPALVIDMLLMTLLLFSAWKMYRLAASGWWLQAGLTLFYGTSGVLTFAVRGGAEFYLLTGDDGAAPWKTSFLIWTTIGSALCWLGYLCWLKRFFTAGGEATATQSL